MSTRDVDFSPLIIPSGGIDPDTFIAYYERNKEGLEEKLLEKGAIKFQGVNIDSIRSFQKIVDSISDKFLSYVDGNSPRTKLTDKVYTSTEYDNMQKITMHNELSYSAKWPGKLFFSCLQPAEKQGETLLADSREILQKMPENIVSEIDERGIMYIRNLHGGKGFGPSWQDTFETYDKEQLEACCRAYHIEFEWRKNDQLKLIQRSKGIAIHRKTSERCWFNQIDQFHPLQLGEEIREAMNCMYDSPEDFPMYVRFGDGKEISESTVGTILRTVDDCTLALPWEKNELLIIDNELVCHGRNPFSGQRKVLVAMSE